MKRKDLGISSKEYDDSLTLERLFYFVSKVKCSTCMFKRPTAVDLQSLELLCDTCSTRCKNVSVIGRDNISFRTVLELEHKYNITPFNSKQSKPKEEQHSKSKHSSRKSEKKHSKNRKNKASRSPEPMSPIESEEEDYVPDSRHSRSIYENPSQYPGMMGLMANNNPQMYNHDYNNTNQARPPYTDRHVDYNNQPRVYQYPELVYQPNYPMQKPYQNNFIQPQYNNGYNAMPPNYNTPVTMERRASNNPFSQDLQNEQQGYHPNKNMLNPYNNVRNPMQNY